MSSIHQILNSQSLFKKLIEQFGSPLYVYDEVILRERCKMILSVFKNVQSRVYYATKANNNIALLKIIHEAGLHFDAMSLGELEILHRAQIEKNKIIFSSNNVSREEFKILHQKKIRVCIDSLIQIEAYCSHAQGSELEIRINLGQGSGHHEKVITAGAVKFGIEPESIPIAIEIAQQYQCKITGLSIHIGSLFLDYTIYFENIKKLLELVSEYQQIETVDFGGGFGIPYNRRVEDAFPFLAFIEDFNDLLDTWLDQEKNKRKIQFSIQPGRYVIAESGVCLTTVQSLKKNYGVHFVGTDLGFNQLLRPTLYDAYHEISNLSRHSDEMQQCHVTGNVCESGDIIGKDRLLPLDTQVGDILSVRDTGAYGYSMASNYNGFLRAAEVLIDQEGQVKLIRHRDTIESILHGQIFD